MAAEFADPLDRLLTLAAMPSEAERARDDAPFAGTQSGLDGLLPILRCPETGQRLRLARDGSLITEDGSRMWPVVSGRPNLFPELVHPRIHADDLISNPLEERALRLIRRCAGRVLNLSAGGTRHKLPNVVEAEAAVFRNTDVLADAHRLPFADGCFDLVIAYNAFEHYRDPRRAAGEIFRVLRPGGRVLIRTAFLQPLHEAPWHFYNCTRYGLSEWFAAFETEQLSVSDNFHPAHTIGWIVSECEAALRVDVSAAAAELFTNATIGEFIAMWRGSAPRSNRLWHNFTRLSQESQAVAAAGFEFLGRRPAE
jgi:SAM-dependent methyltransferase